MNTTVIVKRFDNSPEIARWANSLIGDYVPEEYGLMGVIVNSIVSIQVIPDGAFFLAILLVEVWCPGTEEE